MTLKAGPSINGPAAQGPLPGYDPCPLTSAGGVVIPTGSYPAGGSPRPSTLEFPTGVAGGASSGCESRRRTSASPLLGPPGLIDRVHGRRGILRLRVTHWHRSR